MPKLPDYYAILEVHPHASREVIDAAYRKLAARYHPDICTSQNAADRMKQLNQAYEVLSDPVKRAAYDRSRGMAYLKTPLGKNWRRLAIPVGFILLVLIIAKFKTLGLMLLILAVIIWLLSKTGKR